jgi:hypothetical protein
MRAPTDPPGLEVIETIRTPDRVIECSDGGSASYRTRPPGDGRQILHDRERATVWTRRRPIAWARDLVHRRAGGWSRR